MNKPIYITGHKNPDCDSIVSCIAYSNLKNKMGYDTLPIRLGELNDETKYLLNKYNVKVPDFMYSARCQLKEIDLDEAVLVNENMTMKEALEKILKMKNKGVFVVDDEDKLIGVVSISDLTSIWNNKPELIKELMSKTSLENIRKTIDGKIFNKADKFKSSGVVSLMPSLSDDMNIYHNGIVIVGNNPDIQRYLIDAGASLIIVCGEEWIDKVTLDKAISADVNVIQTSLSALSCIQVVFQSPEIKDIMTTNVISFRSNETVEEVTNKMAKTRYRTYPVINEKKQVVNAVSRYHLFNYEKKRFILVDHNEIGQTVNDIESGEVLEIVDHHRFGGVETANPINIIARTVGATATIITNMFLENDIKIDNDIASILLGAIISDTFTLKSPTTTDLDIKIANYLSDYTGINIEELSHELVESSASILTKNFTELLYDDFKEYRIEDSVIAISQIQCKDFGEYFKIKEDFMTYLQDVLLSRNYDLILIIFTDPFGSGSYFLYTGKKSNAITDGFLNIDEKGFVSKVVSRKKQVVPVIIETLKK